jgi:hypothetical protein
VIQRVLASKGLVAYVLACATGLTLYFRWPFPADDLVLHLIALRAPAIYLGFKYTYTLFLFTTPYIANARRVPPKLLPAKRVFRSFYAHHKPQTTQTTNPARPTVRAAAGQ